MSQQEFEQANQEAMDLANRVKKGSIPQSATPTAPFTQGSHKRTDSSASLGMTGGVKVDTYMYSRAELMRQSLWSLIQVLACVFVGVLFGAAMIDPDFVKFLGHAGVLICGMVAAVKVDRAVQEWKNRGKDYGKQ